MSIQKYSVSPISIGNILNLISLGEIAVPEIQRPFVWSASKVRDLIDSLYQGYGAITDPSNMQSNFKIHCIPDGMQDKDINHYEDFLQQRRKMMSRKIQTYYETL